MKTREKNPAAVALGANQNKETAKAERDKGMNKKPKIRNKNDNLPLIAAAPELLAALKRLRDDVQTAHVGADERCKDCAVCWSLELADAAIAKAEGRPEK